MSFSSFNSYYSYSSNRSYSTSDSCSDNSSQSDTNKQTLAQNACDTLKKVKQEKISSLEYLGVALALKESLKANSRDLKEDTNYRRIKNDYNSLMEYHLENKINITECVTPATAESIDKAFTDVFSDQKLLPLTQLQKDIATNKSTVQDKAEPGVERIVSAKRFSAIYNEVEEARHSAERNYVTGNNASSVARGCRWLALKLGFATPYEKQMRQGNDGKLKINSQAALKCGYGANWFTKIARTYRIYYPREQADFKQEWNAAVQKADMQISQYEKKYNEKLSEWDRKAIILRAFHPEMSEQEYQKHLIELLEIQQQSRKNCLKAEFCIGVAGIAAATLIGGPVGLAAGIVVTVAALAIGGKKMKKDSSIAQHALSFFSDHAGGLKSINKNDNAKLQKKGGAIKLFATLNAFLSVGLSGVKFLGNVVERVPLALFSWLPLLGVPISASIVLSKAGTGARKKANHFRMTDGPDDYIRLMRKLAEKQADNPELAREIGQQEALYKMMFR
jgi:hypothetical protein